MGRFFVGITGASGHAYAEALVRALVAGGIPLMPLADQFWGDRYGQLTDPFGHIWSIGAPIKA